MNGIVKDTDKLGNTNMTVVESDYVQVGAAPMSEYFDNLMRESGISGEELATALECPVDELYELLTGDREITMEHVLALEATYLEASRTFLVGCQMMKVLVNLS